MFENYGSGNQAERDKICVHLNQQSLENTLKDFNNLEIEALRTKYELKKDSRDWSIERAKKDVMTHFSKEYSLIAYRPFDTRWTLFTGKSKGFWGTPSSLSKHFLQGENLGLCFNKFSKDDNHSCGFLTDKLTERCYTIGHSSGVYIAPLYCYDENLNEKEGSLSTLSKIPNFTQEFARYKQKHSLLKDKSPEQILAFIYANLFSPLYRKKYSEYLKIGFPRVNFEVSAKEFDFYEAIGQKLMALHLFQKETLDECLKDESIDFQGEFAKSTVLEALNEKQRFKENTLFLNEKIKIIGISQEIWEFKIGGYEVLKTWLKYRKNKELFKKDLYHLLSICVVIKKTLELQKELEKE